MRDIVTVPCFERPEYTALCLSYLSQARGIDDKEVWLHVDNHGGLALDNPQFNAMVRVAQTGYKMFPDRFHFFTQEEHKTYGNSKNIVTSLQMAYDVGAERIFLVEDDIMVAPDIFDWHEAVLEEPDVFVSCATALNKSAHFQINGPQAMDESLHDPSAYLKVCGPYSSHCAAFKRDNLGRLLSYLTKAENKWAQGTEQDLLTQRVMQGSTLPFFDESERLYSAWPYVPRAYNVGWRSYHINTGMSFNGTLEEKVAALEATIRNPTRLREMSANNGAVTPLPEKWPMRTEPVRNIQGFR